MEALDLKAEVRQAVRKQAKHLRLQGFVPAVLYGRELETISLQIESRSLQKVLTQAGTHQLISLKIGRKQPLLTLARDIQRDVIKRDYLHVDFYAVKMDEKVTAEVPLVITGESPAVKEKGGILTQGLDELEIECLPSDLISAIEVNVEGLLELNDTITVAELTVPSSITVLSEPESMVIKIEPPRKVEELEEEAEAAVEAEEGAEPEVLTAARGEETADE